MSWGLRAVMVVLAVLGAYSFYRGVASLGQRKASPSRSVVAVKALSQIAVGERVVGRNPLRHEVDASEPDPATWRKVALQMRKPSGHRLWIELLRPQVWLERYEVRPGATIFLDLHEMGAMGDADVTSVSPCPAIQPGDGPVVTGTFKHEADENNPTVRLLVEGANQATGVTANHPYWSVDRQTFVPAGDLKPGEQVDTESGPRKIVSVTPVQYTGFLYNLETTEHVFRVGEIGTLVHNSYAPRKEAKDILVLGRGTPEKLDDVAEAVGGRVINNPAASGNPRALWKHIYGEMRKADEIVQVLDDIPTKQVAGRGSGEWACAEKIFIDSMEALRKKRTTVYRADLGLE